MQPWSGVIFLEQSVTLEQSATFLEQSATFEQSVTFWSRVWTWEKSENLESLLNDLGM